MSNICPTCITENSDSASFCIACGSPLTSDGSTTSSSSYHLPAGALLKQGRYKIEKTLGEGGFGITYKGTDLTNLMGVAIKELWPEKAFRQGNTITWPNSISPQIKQQQLSKFQLEANYLSRCVHPNIAKVYDWFEENDSAYIVMEFISGKSLYQVWNEEKPLSEERVKGYIIEIASALKVVHTNNLLHRDIKPENIIIDNQDRAVLIDFGATREFIANQTTNMTQLLTPGYAPLEQYSAKGKRYPATDIYALCASMYELLTGEPPAAATDRVASETLTPPRKLRSDLSHLTEQVILTGMRMKVEERFQTAGQLIDALKGNFVTPLHRKSLDFVKQGNLAEAVQAYEKCLTTEPNNGEAAVELSLVLIHLNHSQTEVAAQRAIQLKPNDGRGYGVLGLINCRKSNWPEAVRQLQQAANLLSHESWVQANLAWALGKTGNWQQAESAIDRAIEIETEGAIDIQTKIKKTSPFVLGLKGWIAVNQKDWKLTISHATPAITKSKQANSQGDRELLRWAYPCLIIALDRAVITQQARDLERRTQEFITQVPDSSFAWGFTGWKQAIQGLWTDAIPNFEKASRPAQAPAWVFENLGISREQLQNIPGAIQAYEAYNQKFPPHAFIQFRLGTLLGRQGQWRPAQSYLEKAVQLQPDYAEAYHNLAWVLFNLKDQKGQVENFRAMRSAYRKAVELYGQQHKLALAQRIKQAFQVIGAEI
ncbi:protein kinase [Microcoleus sp. PH2017_30_WIL_O_A]|uniref:protein kinase domain-containing protein n=1 Tax=Microcoleus sp. PH2017_30_WIL_O_A TaxID=2798840 RepID=UPI001DAAD8DD|nr:protein kinase [Microcoleus sp. PH2017_30_WIL_O_A]MCC3582695.1 protein kinase [Microcoleus sp. PH2017_30_WIL_O_A]